MKNMSPRFLKGILYTIVGGICWGFSGTCGEFIFAHYDVSPLWLTSVREVSAGLLLLALALLRKTPGLLSIWRHKKDALRLVAFSLFGLVLCQYSYMTAISYSNAGTTTVLQNLNLVFIMVLVCVSARRLPSKKEAMAAVLAVTGTYLLATHGNPGQMVLSREGLFWGLVTAVAVTIYTLLPSRIISKWGNLVVMGWGMLVGGTAVGLVTRIWTVQVDWSLGLVLSVVAVSVLGTAVAFALFMAGLTIIGPVRASMLATTEPVAATVFSFLWMGTKFTGIDLVGFALILSTVFLLAGKEEAPQAETAEAPPSAALESVSDGK